LEEGGKNARQRAREIAMNILATHRPLPISHNVDKRIRRLVRGLRETGADNK